VFLSGALFLLISLTPLREWLINAVPLNLKLGIAAGIGLFLALIGLQNAGLVAADATTLVKLGDLTEAKALLAIAGFLAIAGLAARKVPGAIIFGVIAVTLAAVWPGALAQTVPPYATAPALLFVACLMATSLGAIQWDEPTEYIPALTIALMIPFEQFHRHRHWARFHDLCGAEAALGARA
jgi:adenine/guanine/hypoxanthine permease